MANKAKNATRTRLRNRIGYGQMSLVEHSLCPLDPPDGPFIHEAEYYYFPNGKRSRGVAQVTCPLGLMPNDEFYLWGLLGVTHSFREPSIELCASGRYLLRGLGIAEGGKQLAHLRRVIYRLGQVSYFDEDFYDPIRRERRALGFGFFSHDLPKKASRRPWKIVWDPLFFDFCRVAGGYLAFDLVVFRELSDATRRQFLFLRKFFYRKKETPWLDVEHTAIHLLGYKPGMPQKKYNEKLFSNMRELSEHGFIELPGTKMANSLRRVRKGEYQVKLWRGPHFAKKPSKRRSESLEESALYEPMLQIGLEGVAARRVLKKYPSGLVQQWVDVTMARMERGLPFKRSPAAFFMHYMQLASEGKVSAPDWYHEMKRDEEATETESGGAILKQVFQATGNVGGQEDPEQGFSSYLKGDGRGEYEQLVTKMMSRFVESGQSYDDARKGAVRCVTDHMRKRYQNGAATGLTRASSVLKAAS